jgi:hypothetical protein
MAIGALCPWASLLGLASLNGLGVKIGWCSLLAGLAILTLSLDPGWLRRFSRVRRHRRPVAITLAVLSALACLLIIVGVGDTTYGAAVQASWGCYLTLLASIAAVVWAPRPPQSDEIWDR